MSNFQIPKSNFYRYGKFRNTVFEGYETPSTFLVTSVFKHWERNVSYFQVNISKIKFLPIISEIFFETFKIRKIKGTRRARHVYLVTSDFRHWKRNVSDFQVKIKIPKLERYSFLMAILKRERILPIVNIKYLKNNTICCENNINKYGL